MYRRGALLALPLALALAASACGGSSSGGTPTPGTTTTSATSGQSGLPGISINAHPVSDLKQGGTVVWSVDQFGPQWNINQADGNEVSMTSAMAAMIPEPTIFDDKANISYDPNYWTSAKVISQNPQKVEWVLNPKAKWSDGKAISAADFIAQWKALNGSNKKFDPVSTTGYDQISDVSQGKDEFDVIATFKTTYAEWPSLFNPLYPAALNATPKSFDNMYLNAIPVTGGAFKFGGFDKSAQTVTVVPDPNWWGDNKPFLDKIVFKTLESTAANQAFANGEIDYDYSITTDAADYKTAASNPDGKVLVAAGPDQRQFTFHGGGGILKDLQIRRAIAMGTNREAIAKSDLTGLPVGGNIVTLDNHIFVNTQEGYQDNTGDLGKYNPDGAKQTLDADGWKLGSNGVRSKNGQDLVVRFTIPSGIASSKNEAELLQAMMHDIGVKLKIVTVPSNDFFTKYILKGDYDITPFSWIGVPFPASGSAGIYEKGGGNNFTGVDDPAIDQGFKAALKELDPTQYRVDLNEADKAIWAEVHSLMLYQRPQMNGVTNGLANLGSFGFATVDYTKIGYLKSAA
jgi:peptide/nickel transport system substrate-binding protein